MNKSQTIYLNTGNTIVDKHIKIRLENEVNTLELLSMSFDTKDAYRSFNSDYGVLVGRVVANENVGIPNVKISIFIPLADEDVNNSEITSIYPYTTPKDKNNEGKRYNLLPRVGRYIDGIFSPKQPFGSFPIKEEIVSNVKFLNVYKKYYKYTALTNGSGDYMIFGLPTGSQIVHMSVDITDIGKYSMNAASMVNNLGFSSNLFTSDGKIKQSDDLDNLPNIETQEINVDIIPFWGDTSNFEIGITRQDFRIKAQLKTTFTIFGSAFTDGENSLYGYGDTNDFNGKLIRLYTMNDNADVHRGIGSKRIGYVTEKVYSFPDTLTDEYIDSSIANGIDISNEMIQLNPSEYSTYKRNGDFVFIISCNRNKITVSESGKEIPFIGNGGVFTKFRGFITLEYTVDEIPMNFNSYLDSKGHQRGLVVPNRYRYKFPQSSNYGNVLSPNDDDINTINWRNQHMTFSGGTIYSLAKFHSIVINKKELLSSQIGVIEPSGLLDGDILNTCPNNTDADATVGLIQTNDVPTESTETRNEIQEFPSNCIDNVKNKAFFGANWLNFTIHFPQNGYLISYHEKMGELVSNSNLTPYLYVSDYNQPSVYSEYFFIDNTQKIAAKEINTKWFARSDLHRTGFIIVPKEDILKLNNEKTNTGNKVKGGILDPSELSGKYYNGYSAETPNDGGKIGALPYNPKDPNIYYYKGFGGADCIEYITSLGLV